MVSGPANSCGWALTQHRVRGLMWLSVWSSSCSSFLQEEKEQLIEYRSSVANLVGRAKTVVQLRPRSAETSPAATTLIRAVCDYKQIEVQPLHVSNILFDERARFLPFSDVKFSLPVSHYWPSRFSPPTTSLPCTVLAIYSMFGL